MSNPALLFYNIKHNLFSVCVQNHIYSDSYNKISHRRYLCVCVVCVMFVANITKSDRICLNYFNIPSSLANGTRTWGLNQYPQFPGKFGMFDFVCLTDIRKSIFTVFC